MVAHARLSDAQYALLPSSSTPKRKNPQPVESPRARLRIVPPLILPEPSETIRDFRASLAPAIAARLRSGAELVESIARERRGEILQTTIESLDALLGGGLARGKMTEIAGRGGRWSVAFAAIAAATSIGEAAALIDLGGHFDPQLAEAAGIDLRRVLWVRPNTLRQAVTAAEMLGAAGFQLVVLDAGVPPLRGRRVPDAAWVRLARMCETHGCTLLVSAPYALTGTTSEAMLYAGRSRGKWVGGGGAPRLLVGVEVCVTLEKHRRKRPGESAVMFFKVAEAADASSSGAEVPEEPEELAGGRA
jgi:hypothetical protein